MLELLILASITGKIGNLVEEKGHKSLGYKALAVALWIGGEIVGLFLGAAMAGGSESARFGIYIIALLGAAVGVGIAYAVANNLPTVGPSLVAAPRPATAAVALAPQSDPAPKLIKLKELYDAGLVTVQEYEARRAEMLSKFANEPSPAPVPVPAKPYVPGTGAAILAVLLTLVGPIFLLPLLASVPLCIFMIAKAQSRVVKLVAIASLAVTGLYCVAVPLMISLNQ
jgi:hypothetical protein